MLDLKLLQPLAAAALLLGAACTDSTGPGEPRADELRATFALGAGQTGTVGRALADSVVVRVTRDGGAPAAGLPLEWRVLGAGGEVRAAATRTDRDGRSGNVWVLGTVAGAQRLEVRAVVRGAGVVLDTVEAVAEAGPAATLRVVGDTVRDLVVGDSARLAVEGVDAFGNAIPAARLGVRWTSSHPLVASVDDSGAARARALGSASVEASAGEARARLRLRVGGVLEDFVVAPRTREHVGRFVHGAGRTLAVSTTAYHASVYHDVWELESAGWRRYAIGPRGEGGPEAHPVATGTAYAKTAVLFVSPQPGTWRADSSAVSRWNRLAGSGSALFGLRASGYAWEDYTWRAERWENGTLTDLQLPAPYDRKTPADYQHVIAAAGRQELYLSTAAGTVYWNGSAWAPVARPDGDGPLALRTLAAPADGGPVYGVLGKNLVYRLSGGRAERVAHPLDAAGETIYAVSASAAGDPLLTVEGAVHFRVAGEWREHRVPEGFRLQTAGWGAPGVIWISITRPTGEMEYYGAIQELHFQRLTVQRL